MERKENLKPYIEEQYRLAVSQFRVGKLSKNENVQWNARKDMAKLEILATEMYGADYADDLHNRQLANLDLEPEQEQEEDIDV